MLKRNQTSSSSPPETPAARKRFLQNRLKEISAKSEQEISNIMKSVEQIKAQFKSNK